MKIKLMLDQRQFETKPTAYETGGVQKRIQPTEISIKDLSFGLSNGMTCKPALLNGSKSINWVQQQIFMLDFDHNTTIQKELQVCNTLNIVPVFGYTSFSHSEEEHHFRLAFVTDEVITDVDKRNKLQITLINIFENSDKVTYDPTRIFYGGKGKSPIQPNYDARINADDIIAKYYKDEYEMPVKKVKATNTPKTVKTPLTDDYMDNINAIKSLDVNKLRSLITVEDKVILSSEKEVYDFFNNIDLEDFLGFEEGYAINCILPDHEDNSPSAYIWRTKDGTQIYKCFGCDKALSVTSLVEVLANTTRRKAMDFIKQVYGITLYQSAWVLDQKDILKHNIQYLDSDDILVDFPYISKLIRTRKVHIKALMTYFEQFISDDLKINDSALFFGGYTKLMDVCSIKNRNTMAQSLTLFTLLDMLIKVKNEDIPEKELKKAQSISAKYGFKKLTNYYQFTEYGYNQLCLSEIIAKDLIDNHISLKGLSREYVLRTFGTELADKVFPQYRYENKHYGTTTKSDKFTLRISEYILDYIEHQGYIKESDIKINNRTELQYKKSITEILDTYGLVKVRASKVNKELYNIPEFIPYQASVIVREINY
jgi:hypothetical protein